MSWFSGNRNLSKSGKYLITQSGKNKNRVDLDIIDRMNCDLAMSNRLDKCFPPGEPRRDSGAEICDTELTLPEVSYDCDLTSERDVYELVDAMKKILRFTDRSITQQRTMIDEFRTSLSKVDPRAPSTLDKSLVTSLILRQIDALTTPDDVPKIEPLFYKLLAVIDR